MSSVHVSIKGLSLHIERDGQVIGHVSGFSYEGPVEQLPGAMQLAQVAGMELGPGPEPTLDLPPVKLTDLERAVAEAIRDGKRPGTKGDTFAIVSQAIGRLQRKGIVELDVDTHDWVLTAAGRVAIGGGGR